VEGSVAQLSVAISLDATWRRSKSRRWADDVLALLAQHLRHASHHRIRATMIVVLAAVTALVGIAAVAGLRTGADWVPRLGPQPGATSIALSRSCWPNTQRLPVDDVYTAWFDANSRCGEAFRVWLEAAPAARPDAYRAYQVELELEAAAAAELELHATCRA